MLGWKDRAANILIELEKRGYFGLKGMPPEATEEKPIPQMTPKELDKEIGKCVHRIGVLSHELKKRANA